MIKRELLAESPRSIRWIILNVLTQLVRLAANIALVFSIGRVVKLISEGESIPADHLITLSLFMALLGIVRCFMTWCGSAMTAMPG